LSNENESIGIRCDIKSSGDSNSTQITVVRFQILHVITNSFFLLPPPPLLVRKRDSGEASRCHGHLAIAKSTKLYKKVRYHELAPLLPSAGRKQPSSEVSRKVTCREFLFPACERSTSIQSTKTTWETGSVYEYCANR